MNKNFALCFVLLFMYGVSYGQEVSDSTESKFNKLGWVTGNWERIDVEPEFSGHEIWNRTSEFHISGKGIGVNNGDTVFVEKLDIVLENDSIFYVADVTSNKNPIYFGLTHLTDSSFTFENPDHDFPQKIQYSLERDTLTVKISSEGDKRYFLFVRND